MALRIWLNLSMKLDIDKGLTVSELDFEKKSAFGPSAWKWPKMAKTRGYSVISQK